MLARPSCRLPPEIARCSGVVDGRSAFKSRAACSGNERSSALVAAPGLVRGLGLTRALATEEVPAVVLTEAFGLFGILLPPLSLDLDHRQNHDTETPHENPYSVRMCLQSQPYARHHRCQVPIRLKGGGTGHPRVLIVKRRWLRVCVGGGSRLFVRYSWFGFSGIRGGSPRDGSRAVRPGFLGGSRVWKDEGYVRGNHNRKTDDSSVYKG